MFWNVRVPDRGSQFLVGVITDPRRRGIEDILIACVGNLKGFNEAIRTIYPSIEVQTCVVHQIRNSLKYVASTGQKPLMTELKTMYRADNESVALDELAKLKEKENKKYPMVFSSGRITGPCYRPILSTLPASASSSIRPTPFRGYYRQIGKVTKNKGFFTGDMA